VAREVEGVHPLDDGDARAIHVGVHAVPGIPESGAEGDDAGLGRSRQPGGVADAHDVIEDVLQRMGVETEDARRRRHGGCERLDRPSIDRAHGACPLGNDEVRLSGSEGIFVHEMQ